MGYRSGDLVSNTVVDTIKTLLGYGAAAAVPSLLALPSKNRSRTPTFRRPQPAHNTALPYKRKYGKRKRYRKRSKSSGKRRRYSRIPKSIKTYVKRHCKKAKKRCTSSLQEFRISETGQLTSNVNQRGLYQVVSATATLMGEYLDKTMPTIDGSTITWKDIMQTDSTADVKTMFGYEKFEFANNYAYPVEVDCYTLVCKDHTNTSPLTYFQLLMDKRYIDNLQNPITTAEADPLTNIHEVARQGKDKWKIVKHHRKWMPAGTRWIFMSHAPKGVFGVQQYNVANTTYRQNFSYTTIITLRGPVAHGLVSDSQSGNVGYADSKIDYVKTQVYKYVILGKDEMRKIELSSSYDALTNPEIYSLQAQTVTDVDQN